MSSKYSQLKEESIRTSGIYQPEFYRITNKDDKQKFDDLVNAGSIFLFDELYDQLKELIKSRNPSSRFEADDYKRLIAAHLGDLDMDHYGVWVYYPWSKRMVHTLDEDEYIELRTSANKHKITTAERDILARKKVGVIGLSVGQSVSVTMAMERSCGELRLADFDTLELNNLNRIRTGVHNLGLLKAYSVAREIAELDPFFKVVCYTDGITDDNINDFFLDGGKLDAVIDECDGVNIKILCRLKAKELQVPVLMEASDRGTLDVERFDLEPDRPIMHGWLQHLSIDLDVLKNLKTNAEKLPYILPIAGLETLSPRMKASMIEMQVTLTTWPQLATAVTLGGAVTADTARRIFLNQYTGSGRFFIDMETLVPDIRLNQPFDPGPAPLAVTQQEMEKIAGAAMQKLHTAVFAPAIDQLNKIVEAAIKAPSAGNSQPWKWHYKDGVLFLFFADTGIVSFGDFGNMASHLAHGAALENLELEAHKLGLATDVKLFPLSAEPGLTAAIYFDEGISTNLYDPDELVKYIPTRATCRSEASEKKINSDALIALSNAVSSVPGAALVVKTSAEDLAQLANIVGPAERLKLLTPVTNYEYYQREMRWEEEGQSPDGINIRSLALSQPEEIALKMVRDPKAIKHLADWQGGQALEYTSRKLIAKTAAVGLITMPHFSAENNILGGKAAERMWLTAAKHHVSIQPVMTPLLYFARLNKGKGNEIPTSMLTELETLYQRFCALFTEAKGRESIFLFTMGISESPVSKSARRPLKEVFSVQ